MSEEIILQSLQKVENCISELEDLAISDVRDELFLIRDNLQSLLPDIGGLYEPDEDWTSEELEEFNDFLPDRGYAE